MNGHSTPIYSYEDHIGALTYTGTELSRIDTPNGYISEGATRYYISDHQGNVRQVVDSVGSVLQDNHYYPFGMLMGESSDILEANRTQSALSGNPYRYNGNRLITHHNAHFGDFNARWYDFQTLRFLRPDPFREKYYPLPPYLYCAANPIIFGDKFGSVIELLGNEEEVNFLMKLIEQMRKSQIFNNIYNTLSSSSNTFYIKMGEVNNGLDRMSAKKEGNEVTINSEYISESLINARFSIGEETYHLYQDETPDSSEDNKEFEAKTIALLECAQIDAFSI